MFGWVNLTLCCFCWLFCLGLGLLMVVVCLFGYWYDLLMLGFDLFWIGCGLILVVCVMLYCYFV